ncbi:MAG: division plane positioning ATPase MipZ [Bauldia sp.]
MRIQAGAPHSAHVIVLGNEKGGSGKTTTAMHLIVALLKAGQRVASIDTDGRQRSLSRYIENRRKWARRCGLDLELPEHFAVPVDTSSDSVKAVEEREFATFAEAIAKVEHGFDFVVVDTPGANTYLMRLSHSMADTLVTPINDSFIDFDVLGHVDPETLEVTEVSHYSELVQDSRRQRRLVDGGVTDWIVVRNRLSALESRNKRNVARGLQELAMRVGCRLAEGISERMIFREFFPMGLTALDATEEKAIGGEPTSSHESAGREIRNLLRELRLPLDERGKRRAEARRIWQENSQRPLDVSDILADETPPPAGG